MVFLNIEQHEYLDELRNVSEIKLCFVGQDKYPNGATGIAFNKSSFEELMKSNCSGKYILNSLGFDEFDQESSTKYFFINLLKQGIAFINISYELLDNNVIDEQLLIFKEYNKAFLSKSKNIGVLGKSKTTKLFKKYYSDYPDFDILIHPSIRNRNREEWKKVYDFNYLKLKYNI